MSTRRASAGDRNAIIALTRHERFVHTHLDWQRPEDWIGQRPFCLAEVSRRVVAALACPADPPDTAWLRLVAVTERQPLRQAWETLWPHALAELEEQAVDLAAALSMDDWLPPLLEAAGFRQTHDVVGLRWAGEVIPSPPSLPASLRPIRRDDLEAILRLDSLSFQQPWRLSRQSLGLALTLAAFATVAQTPQGELVGYQISTVSRRTGHLARLAVHPAWRGAGLGRGLVLETLEHFRSNNIRTVTVNTQSDNSASLALYQALGFTRTGDVFPAYQLPIR